LYWWAGERGANRLASGGASDRLSEALGGIYNTQSKVFWQIFLDGVPDSTYNIVWRPKPWLSEAIDKELINE